MFSKKVEIKHCGAVYFSQVITLRKKRFYMYMQFMFPVSFLAEVMTNLMDNGMFTFNECLH